MVKHLEGKIAIVTGGAGGMGSWIAKTYAAEGAKVIVADTGSDVEGRMGMDASKVDAVVNDIKAAGGEAVSVVGDIADMDTAEKTVKLAIDTYGGLDILCCAHGILRERMIFNMAEEEWDGLVRAHLKGCFAPTKFASIYWRQERNRGGRIIYFTSDAGIFGSAGQPNYSAAHAGKLGLMRSNARALERYGVTCNVIAPSASTRMTDRGLAVERDAPAPSLAAAGTARDPRNLSPLAVWLASDEGGIASGCMFGGSGHRVTLYNNPTVERAIYSETPFHDIDRLFEEWPATMALGGYPMPRMPGAAPARAGAAAGGGA
jgi:NAD(P)-dependent dehydrogenase (short-subunit alcohol dehydrogenase family)